MFVRLALRLGVLVAAAAIGAARPALAQQVLVVADTDDAAAAERLVASLEEPAARAVASPRPADTLRARACREHDVAYVIALDGRGGVVHVVRCADATLVSRGLEPGLARQAPYAMAVVAEELLELIRTAPLATAPAALAAARVAAPGTIAVRVRAGPSPVTGALGLGVLVAAGLDGTAAWAAPRLGADVVLGRSRWPMWLAIGLRFAPLGMRTYAVEDAAGTEIAFWRHEGALRLALGRDSGGSALVAWAEAGVALVLASAATRDGAELGHDRRLRALLAAGAELRYTLTGRLTIGLELGVGWSPKAVRYHVGGPPILEDGSLTARAALSLGTELRN